MSSQIWMLAVQKPLKQKGGGNFDASVFFFGASCTLCPLPWMRYDILCGSPHVAMM